MSAGGILKIRKLTERRRPEMTAQRHDDRARMAKKIAREVTGELTARSPSPYLPKKGAKELAVCDRCHLIYQNKRWYLDEAEATRLLSDPRTHRGTCPVCRRMEDNLPAGTVTLAGTYFHQHEGEILDLIKNTEARIRTKNPLGRIMEIAQEGDHLTVSTTDDKLAQKVGREVYRAHKGELHFKWSQNQEMVRVSWQR
jgi:NMD protein affecting ribosome stability and mRNA decay